MKSDCQVVSKIISYGPQRWRINEDKTWSVEMYGSFPNQSQSGLVWKWVGISESQVPREVKKKRMSEEYLINMIWFLEGWDDLAEEWEIAYEGCTP